MRVYRWHRLDHAARKWTLWSIAAVAILAIGSQQHDVWALGALGLMFWAFAD